MAETLRKTMSQNPYLKIFVANGYYDLATPYFATEYTFNHLEIEPSLQQNISMAWYEAGHMMYVHPPYLGQIKSDMDDTLSDCIRSHPVANALMAQYAQTKDLKLYDQARQLVLTDARKKLEVRLATAILNKATDEIEQREAMHRYPVEITEDIKTKITAGDLVAAMQVIEIAALQLMKHFLPELYRSNFTIEQ